MMALDPIKINHNSDEELARMKKEVSALQE